MYAIYVTNILLLLLLSLLSLSSSSSSSSSLFIITALITAYYGSIFQRKDFLNFFKVVLLYHKSHYSKNKLNSS